MIDKEKDKTSDNLIKMCGSNWEEMMACNKAFTSVNKLHAKKPRIMVKKKSALMHAQSLKVIAKSFASWKKLLEEIVRIRNMDKSTFQGGSIRRGVLMTLLQETANCMPLWSTVDGEKAPPLCGAVQIAFGKVTTPGYHVAALVPDLNASPGGQSSLCWILAEIVSYDNQSTQYLVEDVDSEEGKVQYSLTRKNVIPLPKWKANPITNPEAIFPNGALVLALYPQTTCFYRAIVYQAPETFSDDYALYFEDSTYKGGYSPSILVPQRYVISCCTGDESVNSGTLKNKRRQKYKI